MSGYGERLKQALSLKGCSQTALAKAVGVKPQSIQFICAGRTKNGSTRTHAIARHLGINAKWLQDGEGPMEGSPIARYVGLFETLSEEDRLVVIRIMEALQTK